MQKKNLVIGLILEDYYTDYSRELIENVKRSLPVNRDIRLVVVAGKYVDKGDGTVAEYKNAYNSVCRLASICSMDGLIIRLGRIDDDDYGSLDREFLKKVSEIPSVFITSKQGDYVSVGFDNLTGIRDVIDSMVNLNGIRKLCMLGGRGDNCDAQMRKQAFIDCLESHKIPFDESMFEAGDMSVNTEAAADRLLDRNPDVEGIFCVNDSSAVGLYKAMKKRRLVPGKDICVFGFDNSQTACSMKPALTSVGPGRVSIGQRAVEMLLAMIGGAEVQSELVPTAPYSRDSYRYTVYEYNRKDILKGDMHFIYRMFDECFYRYMNGRSDREYVDLRRLFHEIISRMLRGMNNRYVSLEEFQEISRLISIFFSEGAMEYTDCEQLLSCINRLQGGMAIAQKARGAMVNEYINRLFLQMKDSAIRALSEKNASDSSRYIDGEGRIGKFLVNSICEPGSENDLKKILSSFGDLGLMNAAVYMFEKPVRCVGGKADPFPEQILLVCGMKNGEFYIIPQERSHSPMSDMFDRKELSPKCRGFVTMPVFFRNKIYGFIICELTEDIYARGEYIAMIMGRSLFINGWGE